MQQYNPVPDRVFERPTLTFDRLLRPEHYVRTFSIERLLAKSSIFHPPASDDRLIELAEEFADRAYEFDQDDLDTLDRREVLQSLPAIAVVAIDIATQQREAARFRRMPVMPELKLCHEIRHIYGRLINKLVLKIDFDTFRLYHSLTRNRYVPPKVRMREGYTVENIEHTNGKYVYETANGNKIELPDQEGKHWRQVIAIRLVEMARESLKSYRSQQLVDWEDYKVPTVTVRTQTGTPRWEQFFTAPLKPRHVLQSAVAASDTISYGNRYQLNELADAVEQYLNRIRRSGYDPLLSQHSETFNECQSSNDLRAVFQEADDTHLFDSYDGFIVEDPDRPSPRIEILDPEDFEQLPCVENAYDRMAAGPALQTTAELIRLMRGVEGPYDIRDIERYLRDRLPWYEFHDEEIKTLLSREQMEIPPGCDSAAGFIQVGCIGQDLCPYRMMGSLELTERAKSRIFHSRSSRDL